MAAVFRFVDDNGTVLHDFLTGDLIALRDAPLMTDAYPVTQTFTLLSDSANHKRIEAIESVSTILSNARRAVEQRHVPNYIWLELHEASEYPKRALVYGGSIGFPGGFSGSVGVHGGSHNIVTMAVTRGAWESTEPITLTFEDTIPLQGGAVELPAMGDLPGRISRMTVGPITGTSAETAQTLYIGIRRPLQGTADFDPLFPISETRSISSTSFSNMNAHELPDAFTQGQDFTHWQGRYRLLLHGSLAAAITSAKFYVRQYSSLSAVGNDSLTKTVVAEDGTLKLDFGTVDIPYAGYNQPFSSEDIELLSWQLWYAVLTGTTGNLVTDHLVFIPADTLFYSTNALVDADTAGTYDGSVQYIDTSPDGVVTSYSYVDGENLINRTSSFELSNWEYPHEGGLIALSDHSDSTTTVDLTIEVYPRWRHYRTRAQ